MNSEGRQNEDERLRAMLREDASSPEDAEAHVETVRQLRRWQSPQPDADDTARLVAALLPELGRETGWRGALRRAVNAWPVLLLRAQARVVQREIWAASALVMLIGVLVTLAGGQVSGMTPLMILAPIVAAAGVALLYDSDLERMLELEESTLASVRLLLLARLTLVFGCNLLFGLVASAALALLRADMLLWPLVLSWLAPMAFLSALAFWLSVATGDSVAGMVFSLAVWALHVVMRQVALNSPLTLALSLPGLSDPAWQPILLVAAAALVAVALGLIGQTERRSGETV